MAIPADLWSRFTENLSSKCFWPESSHSEPASVESDIPEFTQTSSHTFLGLKKIWNLNQLVEGYFWRKINCVNYKSTKFDANYTVIEKTRHLRTTNGNIYDCESTYKPPIRLRLPQIWFFILLCRCYLEKGAINIWFRKCNCTNTLMSNCIFSEKICKFNLKLANDSLSPTKMI